VNRRIGVQMLAWAMCLPLAAAAAPAAPLDGQALVAQKRCVACHDLDQPLIGPPYRAIAARHAQQRALMTEVLAHKIVSGGGGTWGYVPMVPNEHVTLAEARAMAAWILSLGPDQAP